MQEQSNRGLLIRSGEAATLLSISRRKLWALTFEEESLPYIRCGRLVRYSIADLERWITTNRKGVSHV